MEEALTGYLEGGKIGDVARVLKTGGVAVLPTDTIYGLHCACSRSSSIDRIIRLKGRKLSAGLILLASSIEMVDGLVGSWPAGSREILGSLWPAPLTAILPASAGLLSPLRPGGGLAVRVPSMPSMLRLIEKTGEPLVSTSVNRSGEKPLNRIDEIRRRFPGFDAYIARRGRGNTLPSTVIDLREREPRLVRRGAEMDRATLAFGID